VPSLCPCAELQTFVWRPCGENRDLVTRRTWHSPTPVGQRGHPAARRPPPPGPTPHIPQAATRGHIARSRCRRPALRAFGQGKSPSPILRIFSVEAAIGTCRWPQRSGSHRDSRSRGWYNRGDKAAAREWRSADAETDIHCSSDNVASSSFYRVDVVHIRTSLSARSRRQSMPL
jgi:hypothetical protein